MEDSGKMESSRDLARLEYFLLCARRGMETLRLGSQENARNTRLAPNWADIEMASRAGGFRKIEKRSHFNDAVLPRREDARGHEQLAAAWRIRKTALAERMISAA